MLVTQIFIDSRILKEMIALSKSSLNFKLPMALALMIPNILIKKISLEIIS